MSRISGAIVDELIKMNKLNYRNIKLKNNETYNDFQSEMRHLAIIAWYCFGVLRRTI